MKPVDSFVLSVRRRLNKNRACRAALWAVIAGGTVLLTIALIYVFRGYEVPRYWYGIAAAATVVGAAIGAMARRASVEEAVEYADSFFGIRDTIVSSRRFEAEHKTGGYYDLQAGQTADVVRPLDAKRVPFVWPQMLGAAACVLAMGCLLTAFKSTDQEILDRFAKERETEVRFEQVKEELLKAVDELDKSTTDEEERKALDPDQLRELVKKLESAKEIEEVLKQLANLERKLDSAAKNLELKRDEQLLKKAGEELAKEEDPQARELAKKLKNEQFKEAAKDLAKMKPEDAKLAKDMKLSDKRKEAAKLKAAAKRMAAAARQQKSNMSKSGKEGDSKKITKQDKNSENKAQSNQDPNSKESNSDSKSMEEDKENELAEEMEKLEMEADEFDKELAELEEGEKLGKIDISKLEKCEGDGEKLRLRLDKMGDKFAKIGMKCDAKKKLLGMCKKAGQCQSFMQGMCQLPGAAKGGLKPGNGSVDISRDERDELTDNGNTTQLKGQKGTGPSITKIESAEDGSGTSHRKGEAKERAFKKQFESFVQREDVPEDVKDGVKQYFESLHAAEPAAGATKPAEAK